MIPNLKVEVLSPVISKVFPREEDFKALDNLAGTIAEKQKSMTLLDNVLLEKGGGWIR